MAETASEECHSLLMLKNFPDSDKTASSLTATNTFVPKAGDDDKVSSNEKQQNGGKEPRIRTRTHGHTIAACFRTFLATEVEDVTKLTFWQACLAEFVGTFLLCVYTIGIGLYMPDAAPPNIYHVALGVGQFVAVTVTCIAAVSGAHINPAVTLGFAALRHISLSRAVAFIIFQCAGAVSGTLTLKEIIHPDLVGTLGLLLPGKGITDKQATLMEVLITAFLMFAVIAFLDKGRTDIQGSVPMMVGFAVSVNIMIAGPSTGACMNPARAFGPAVVMGNFSRHWIYWVGPCCGGVIGPLLYDKLFSVGASCTSLMGCCSLRSTEYRAAIKQEAARLSIDIETSAA